VVGVHIVEKIEEKRTTKGINAYLWRMLGAMVNDRGVLETCGVK